MATCAVPILRDDLDRRIVRLAVPALGTLAVEPLYILVDTAIVGRLGTPQLAGAAIASIVLLNLVALVDFLEYVTPDIAFAVGAGREADARKVAGTGLSLALLMGIPWVLTLLQGETGSVLVMIFVFGVMMYFGGIRMKVMGGIIAVGVLLLVILYGVIMASGIDDYRITRILSFVNPELVDEDATYQVTQSKTAIGAGGLNGIGMFVQGSFSQLDYVPEDWTDFIFSTIGEAFGFWGCLAVLGAYFLMILRMAYLAYFTQERFGQMVIIGVMAMMLFHVFQNVAMTIGLMPITGIPLPFLSYGGSNLVTNMAGIGLVLNMVMNRSVTSMQGLTPQTRIRGRYTG